MPLLYRAIRAAAAAGALFHPLLSAAPAAAADKDVETSKLYAGVGLAATNFEGDHGGIAYGETAPGLALYGGFQVRDLMGIELAFDRTAGIDSGNILGSGVQRLNISGDLTSVTVRGVFSLPLEEVLRRHQKITLIGVIGLAHTVEDRKVTELTTSTVTKVAETDDGVVLGAGVIFDLKRMRWRATLQSLDREGPSLSSIGIATEFRF